MVASQQDTGPFHTVVKVSGQRFLSLRCIYYVSQNFVGVPPAVLSIMVHVLWTLLIGSVLFACKLGLGKVTEHITRY